MNTPDDNEFGYFIECDLEYPAENKEKTENFPLCPYQTKADPNLFSEYMNSVEQSNYKPTEKLMCDLTNKYNYRMHYRMFKFYTQIGMKVTKIHTIYRFKQSLWLEKYINHNTQKRTKAKTNFEKDLYKLMNNAFFGKTMSQVGQAGMILNEDELDNILNSLDQNKITITNNIIQLLYDKGLFDSFPNKDQAFANYLTFSETYLLEKYGKTILTSDGEYYLSDLEYSTRQSILDSLKKDSYKDLVDMKHRMKLTPTEINFILYD